MLLIRKLIESDYDTLVEWFKWFRFTVPPKEMLPQNGCGGIMVHKEVDICAGFIYRTDSQICWMEFIISNPNYRESDRAEAIKFLIESLSSIAKSMGYSIIFTSVKEEHLINHLKKCGFTIEKGTSKEMVKAL